MANVWFSADFHFGHSNIIRYCDRPFANATEMDEAILDRVNESVKADDGLHFLGDFCVGGPKVAVAYRQKIRCKKVYFILGNHDRVIKKIVDQFVWAKEIAEVNIRNQPIVLCHYAMRVWHHPSRGPWQSYGHSHGKLPVDKGSRSMDVGVDTNDSACIRLKKSERSCEPSRLAAICLILRARSLVVGPPRPPLADVVDDTADALVVRRVQPQHPLAHGKTFFKSSEPPEAKGVSF